MGPRSFERGKQTVLHRRHKTNASFNGAAFV